jgi:hypothetical protein
MARIKGSESYAVMVMGDTGGVYGTAEAAGAGDRIACKTAPAITSQLLSKNPVGTGQVMAPQSIVGRKTPVVTLSGDVGYRNGFDKVLAQFFGTSSAPAEQTPTKGDYMHRLTLNTTGNYVKNTFAYLLASGDTLEFPSAMTRSIGINIPEVHAIAQYTAEILGNKAELSSAVNTAAVVTAATISDSEVAVAIEDSDFWINVSSAGALSGSDQVNITSYNLTLTRPQDFIGNIKGTPGNAVPVETDVVSGTLTITFQELTDKAYYTAWEAETVYKSKLKLEGSIISAGSVNRAVSIYLPLMKLENAPEYQTTEAGYNTVTLNFTLFAASAAPTGMSSVYPYVELINTRTTTYVA